MLKAFRDNLKYLAWVLWLVIAVFVLFVFVDFGAGVPGGVAAPSDAAATVGRYKVRYGEFERAYRQAETNFRQAYGDQFNRDLAQQIGLPLQVLDQLINDKILLDEARRMGLRVTDEEVRRAILQYPVFQDAEGRFVGETEYAETLRANGFTVDGFEQGLRSDLLAAKVRELLATGLHVTDNEVERAYREQVEQADIRYLRLPASSVAAEVAVGEEEVASWFAERREEFRIPERRIVHYLLLDTNQLRATLEVDPAEQRRYYQDNSDEFASDEQVRARHILLRVGDQRDDAQAESELTAIRTRIEAGEDFAALAAELSDDPGSKTRGGDLGFFGRGRMIPEFEEAAFNASPGDLVGPIKTAFGYHLIEVLEKKPAGQQAYEEVADRIRAQLLGERAVAAAETKARELAGAARDATGTDGLRALAESEPAVSFETTPAFGRDDNVPGIGAATAFSVAAFDLAAGDTSEPVKIARGWAVLRLGEVQPPRLPELAEVRERARAALQRERQLALARARLDSARQEVAAGKPLEEVAAALGLEVEESGLFGRAGAVGSLGLAPEVAKAALALDEGAVGGPVVRGDEVVLFQVTERRRFDPADFQQNKEETRERVHSQRLAQVLEALIDKRRQELNVKYDTQLLRNFELVPGDSADS